MPHPLELTQWLEQLIPTIREAGALVMRVYASDFQIDTKADQSPVTLADQMAEDLITQALQALTPADRNRL